MSQQVEFWVVSAVINPLILLLHTGRLDRKGLMFPFPAAAPLLQTIGYCSRLACLAVQRPVLYRFGKVLAADSGVTGEIGNRAGQLKNPGITSG